MPDLTTSDIQAAQLGFCRTVILSLGIELGLFECLASAEEPGCSVPTICSKLSLRERYINEWCQAAVALALIQQSQDGSHFYVSADSLKAIHSVGPHSVLITVMMPVFAMVRDACRTSGPLGVGYEHYDDFHRIELSVTRERFDSYLVQEWLPMTPVWDRLLSGDETVRILDVGCGCGHAVNIMAARFPAAEVIGVDLSTEAIGEAQKEAAAMKVTNAKFCQYDVCGTDPAPPSLTQPFDLIFCFMVVHDLPHPDKALRWIGSMLKATTGAFYMMEVDSDGVSQTEKGFYLTTSLLHCMTTSLSVEGGAGLGNTVEKEEWRRVIEEQAGLQIREVLKVPGQNKLFWVIGPRDVALVP